VIVTQLSKKEAEGKACVSKIKQKQKQRRGILAANCLSWHRNKITHAARNRNRRLRRQENDRVAAGERRIRSWLHRQGAFTGIQRHATVLTSKTQCKAVIILYREKRVSSLVRYSRVKLQIIANGRDFLYTEDISGGWLVGLRHANILNVAVELRDLISEI